MTVEERRFERREKHQNWHRASAPVLAFPAARAYSVITVDCPVSSKRLRQRMFLQAIMSSLRTM